MPILPARPVRLGLLPAALTKRSEPCARLLHKLLVVGNPGPSLLPMLEMYSRHKGLLGRDGKSALT